MCGAAGVEVASRYVLPSAHLTVARFVDQSIYEGEGVEGLVKGVEEVNEWLRESTWGREGGEGGVQWIVGEGKGLVCRKMRVWYGDGESDYEGKGFAELAEMN